MQFIPVPFVINLFVEYQLPNQVLAGNSLWIRDTLGQPNAARITTLCQAVVGWWTASLRSVTSNEVALRRLNGRDMTVQNGAVVNYTAGLPVPGTATSPAMPANVTLCLSLRTGFAGRSRRGRLYHISLTELQVTGSFVGQGFVTTFVNAYNDLRANVLPAINMEWVVVSRFSNGQPRSQGLVTPIINVIAVDNRVDTQRRRLPGIGT